MKIVTQIVFFIGVLLFLLSYIIYPYKVNEGDIIIIDEDSAAFLKMLYTTTSILFGGLFFLFLKVFKNKSFTILSLIFLVINLGFLCRMFLYFDSFIE